MIELLHALFAIETDFIMDETHQRRGLRLLLDGCGKHRCVKVAQEENEVVGMCTAQLVVSTAEGAFSALVEDLVVAESCRGRGVGTALLSAVDAWARQHGATRLYLLADRTNQPALDFYWNRGWRKTRMICLRKIE